MALGVGGREEERFAVVGERDACPVWFLGGDFLGGHGGAHVEGCEGGFVVVSQVVEEDAVRGGGGDGYYCC